MNYLKKIAISGLIGMCAVNVTAQIKYTNQTVDMRKGPGAFYEMLLRLYMNNEVKVDSSEGYWEFVGYQNNKGWVPSYALSDERVDQKALRSDSIRTRRNLMFAQLGGADDIDEKELSASPAQIAAAVKGFAKKYRQSKGVKVTVDFEKFQIPPFTVAEYISFKKARMDVLRINEKEGLLYPSAPFMQYAEPAIDQIGYAVATVLAQEGLVQNYEAQKYLDMMIALIVEMSHRPELETHAYILDTDKVVGYSLPGNFIFISKGAIQTMNSEAELAHFLSHEVAHIIFGHGIQEYDKREPKIRAEDAFAELRNAFEDTNELFSEAEQNLNIMADEVYDYINKDRLETYETEADYWGLVYTYLIGLDPHQARNYLRNIDQIEEKASLEWSGLTLDKRLRFLDANLTNEKLGRGKVNSVEFQAMKATLNGY